MDKLFASTSAILGLAVISSCHEHKTVNIAPPQSAQAEPVQPETGPAEANTPVAGPGESMVGERGGACPTTVAGTKVSMVDVAGGIALDFTSKADVPALRERVHQLATAPTGDVSSISVENGAGSDAYSSGVAPPQGVSVSSVATVEDLPDGARLILTPQDQHQLPSLRAQTEAQLPQLDQGDCTGLAISNVQARIPEPKANRTPLLSTDPQQPIPQDPDDQSAQPESSQPQPPQP